MLSRMNIRLSHGEDDVVVARGMEACSGLGDALVVASDGNS